jgi:hypothetical protein
MTSNVSSLVSAAMAQDWTFFPQKMNSNALKAASNLPTVPGSVFILIPQLVIC